MFMRQNNENFSDKVKEQTDIVEVVSEYVNLKRTGKNYQGLCPFHQENTPSFTVNPDNQFFYCILWNNPFYWAFPNWLF